MTPSATAESLPDRSITITPELLGYGAQATVYKGTFGGRTVAVKVFKPQSDGGHKYANYYHELSVLSLLSELKHANIIELICPRVPRLALEFLPESLCCSLDRHAPVSLSQRLIQLCDIAAGICFINQQGFLYLDLKPDNVMLTSEGRCKLIDFASAEKISRPSDWIFTPTCFYQAPELSGVWAELQDGRFCRAGRDNRQYGVTADAYGLGLVSVAVVQENCPIGYSWDVKDGQVFDFTVMEAGGRPHYLGKVFELFPISYKGDAEGPFACEKVRAAVKARLAYPALAVVAEQRMTPEQFLAAARELHASYCTPGSETAIAMP